MNVFSFDPYLAEFLKGNWQTILLLFGLLKGLAVLTPGTTDDKIITMIQNLFTRKKKEDE
jgi:hypothetical protein